MIPTRINERDLLQARLRSHGIKRPILVERTTEGLDLQLATEAQPARFECRCSRERAADSLKFFNPEERQEMIEAGGQEIVCHWCGERYQLSPDEIAALDEQHERAQA